VKRQHYPHPKPSKLGKSTVQIYSGLCLGSQYICTRLSDLSHLSLSNHVIPKVCQTCVWFWQPCLPDRMVLTTMLDLSSLGLTWLSHPRRLGLEWLSYPSRLKSLKKTRKALITAPQQELLLQSIG
jgi:hypothetical protein